MCRFGTEYTDTKSLRYGHLMIMTDQDHDGSHIKGLLINVLHHFWPSLLKLDGFLQASTSTHRHIAIHAAKRESSLTAPTSCLLLVLQEFITPIVKASKGKKEEVFYTMPEYEAWKDQHDGGNGWTIKVRHPNTSAAHPRTPS